METTTLPISPDTFWGLVTIGGFVVAVLLVFGLLLPMNKVSVPVLEKWQKRLGVTRINPGLFLLATVIWLGLFVMLSFGLLVLIWEVLWHTMPGTDAVWSFRFKLAQLVAVTGVLGAVVAFPVTLNRLRQVQEQTKTAKDSLFNAQITEAAADLYAQRQITVEDAASKGRKFNAWEDDIVRRNAVIDRLEGLVKERPEEAERVSRLLSVYVRELSREHPAKRHPYMDVYDLMHPADDSRPLSEDEALHELQQHPDNCSLNALQSWTIGLQPIRSDMENAVQVLGRLCDIPGVDDTALAIDLRGANLQGFNLRDLCFPNNARFDGAKCRGRPSAGRRYRGRTSAGHRCRGQT